MSKFIVDFILKNWGDVCSLFGLLVSIISLIFAYHIFQNSKTIEEAIKESSAETKSRIGKNFTIDDLRKAQSLIEEIKRLNHASRWEIILDRYGSLKNLLAEVKFQCPDFSEEQKTFLQGVIPQLVTMENKIEKILLDDTMKIDISLHNATLSKQSIKISEIIASIKNQS